MFCQDLTTWRQPAHRGAGAIGGGFEGAPDQCVDPEMACPVQPVRHGPRSQEWRGKVPRRRDRNEPRSDGRNAQCLRHGKAYEGGQAAENDGIGVLRGGEAVECLVVNEKGIVVCLEVLPLIEIEIGLADPDDREPTGRAERTRFADLQAEQIGQPVYGCHFVAGQISAPIQAAGQLRAVLRVIPVRVETDTRRFHVRGPACPGHLRADGAAPDGSTRTGMRLGISSPARYAVFSLNDAFSLRGLGQGFFVAISMKIDLQIAGGVPSAPLIANANCRFSPWYRTARPG